MKALGEYIRNPQLRVVMKEYFSSSASVFGAINTLSATLQGTRTGPGVYPLTGRIRVLDLILQAGGPTTDARLDQVRLTRQNRTFSLDVQKAITRGDFQQNIFVESGDVIQVGGISQADRRIVVLGEVSSPGVFNLSSEASVFEALAASRGFTEVAAASRMRIIRRVDPKNPTIITVNGNRILHGDLSQNIGLVDGDIVVVPQDRYTDLTDMLNKLQPLLAFGGLVTTEPLISIGGYQVNEPGLNINTTSPTPATAAAGLIDTGALTTLQQQQAVRRQGSGRSEGEQKVNDAPVRRHPPRLLADPEQRKIIVIFATVMLGLTSYTAYMSTPQLRYESTAKLQYAEAKSAQEAYIQALGSADALETEQAVITSYPVLERVAHELGFVDTLSATYEVRIQNILRLQGKVRTAVEGLTSILTITVTDTDPDRTQTIANKIATVYEDYSYRKKNAQLIGSRTFIKNQRDTVRARLLRSQNRLKDFQEETKIVSVDIQIDQVLDELNAMRDDLLETSRLVESINEILNAYGRAGRIAESLILSVPPEQGGTRFAQLNAQLQLLNEKRSRLLVNFRLYPDLSTR